MNLERFLELVLDNPDNISIEYSNINGKKTVIVNGENLSEKEEEEFECKEEPFDDTQIKANIVLFKRDLEKIDDHIFELVLDECAERGFNMSDMTEGLELVHFSKEEAAYAQDVIDTMRDVIGKVINDEIDRLKKLSEIANV